MTPQTKKIKKLMIDCEVSGADIAGRIGVDRSMVSLTIAGKKTSLRVRKAIADSLSVSLTDLWPDETRHLKKDGRRVCRKKKAR